MSKRLGVICFCKENFFLNLMRGWGANYLKKRQRIAMGGDLRVRAQTPAIPATLDSGLSHNLKKNYPEPGFKVSVMIDFARHSK